jgi:hypothetical protein
MATGQKLRGLVGQEMRGRRRVPTSYSYSYPAGSYTWTCPATGWWRFVLWGAGSGCDPNANVGGGSGALYIAERLVPRGHAVSILVGACAGGLSVGGDSAATFRSGETITAGGSAPVGVPGAASANRNADIVHPGSPGGTAGSAGAAGLGTAGGAGGTGGTLSGGAGAPGYGTHRGGDGISASSSRGGESPGGGGAVAIIGGNASGTPGGDGLALIYRVRLAV